MSGWMLYGYGPELEKEEILSGSAYWREGVWIYGLYCFLVELEEVLLFPFHSGS